jgi:hypothetical protein
MEEIMGHSDILNIFKEHLISPETISNTLPQRIQKSLNEVAPDSLFLYNDKPLILHFKTTHNLSKEDIFKKYWNFAESPIIFVETETDVDVYNGFSYVLEDKKPTPEKLNIDNLNYLSLISGEYFNSDAFEKSEKRLDTVLLKNIKYAREKLIVSLSKDSLKDKLIELNKLKDKKKKTVIFNTFTKDENTEYNNILHIANALLGRIIFIRYLIDREIALFYENKKQILTNDDLKNILSEKSETYQFFKDLQSKEKGFNGDWFPIGENEEHLVKNVDLKILQSLISGTQMESGQGSLFDYYDFSIIPIEFISNVYEHFIGEDKQKQDGAYYTPTFLVDYVLKYTVDEYFKNNPDKYNCKVLDPACGSGIFLVETFRKLVSQYEKTTGVKADEVHIKQLVKDNIFGIDYNKNALEISVFSLYLAMLDYQDPKDIEDFKFPYLLDTDKNEDRANFFENDFFNIDAPYNDILKEEKLDFIIGNPPYGRSTIKAESFANQYIKEEKLSIGNNDIVQPFMVRVKDLSSDTTQVSFIVTSKVLYNLQTKEFRIQHFFNQFKIKHILELSSVRKQIFENADTPVSIIFYRYSTKEEVLKNTINYISMKPSPYFEKLKLLLISKSDFKKVSQARLLEYDYLWKILVYGSYLDFNLIKRLKKNKPISSYFIESKQGIMIGGGNMYDSSHHIGKPFIETKDIEYFFIKKSNKVFEKKYVHRLRTNNVFQAPALLTSQGIDEKTLNIRIGLLKKDSIFTSSITALKTNDEETLYQIMGLYNSTFFKYFILLASSYIGIEREKLLDDEKFNIPFSNSKKIVPLVKKIEKLQDEYFNSGKINILTYENNLKNLRQDLTHVVLEAFSLSEQEYALTDYATNIVAPWIMQKDYDVAFSQYPYEDNKLDEYVKIFTDHYANLYKDSDMYFQATIHWSQYAIGIYFRTLKKKPKELIIWEKEENIENFLTLMQGKTLENLFIQKDIKGFESDGFYVVKPNEIKNWHKAIGYLDFYEFKDAILRAGKNKWKK